MQKGADGNQLPFLYLTGKFVSELLRIQDNGLLVTLASHLYIEA